MHIAASTWVLCLTLAAIPAFGQAKPSADDLAGRIDRLLASPGALGDVIRIFGEPQRYAWDRQSYTKGKLPSVYLAVYPGDFSILINGGQIQELRHEGPTGYLLEGKIGVGSTLEEVLAVLGEPSVTVTGKACEWKNRVLYKDINGNTGQHYYARQDKKVRLFFANGKVSALYQTLGGSSGPFEMKVWTKVSAYDDVRSQDLSKLSFGPDLVAALRFNQDTRWPESILKAGPKSPAAVLEAAKNPGLGVRALHRQGITGKGVNVAIIDQPLYQDHPEFAGKIAAYHDVGCKSESSMHGPAVASLLVGESCGTAPGARLYYVAAPSWTKDSAYYAKAMDWILEQNKALPPDQKIRVVSVSAAPSGEGSPFTQNQPLWDEACKRAEAAGILVLDCTHHRGIIGPGWYDRTAPEVAIRFSAGHPGNPGPLADRIAAPCSGRTTAEEYVEGECKYAHWGQGGLSWSIPHVAGVLAMGWQVNPQATPRQMQELLFRSAVTTRSGGKVINPPGFVAMVRKASPSPAATTK